MLLTWELKRIFTNDRTGMTFTHEPTGRFSKFYNTGSYVNNESILNNPSGTDHQVDYENDVFKKEPKRLTAEAMQRFGLKALPQFGAYGFYVTKYSDLSKVIIPLPDTAGSGTAPSVLASQGATSITVTITDPTGYDCYRVLFRLGEFAEEFVSYESPFEVPLLGAASYDLTVIGYSDEGDHSVESEPVNYTET